MPLPKNFLAFIESRPWPKGFYLDSEEHVSHYTLVIYEDNFKSLSGEDQVKVASMIKEVMTFSMKIAVPANLKVERTWN